MNIIKDNDMLAYRLNKFGNRLMSLVITPLMDQNQNLPEITISGNPMKSLRFACSNDNQSEGPPKPVPNSRLMMDKLEEIFFFLNETTIDGDENIFLQITTLTSKITSISSSLVCSDDEKTSLMTSVGDLLP